MVEMIGNGKWYEQNKKRKYHQNNIFIIIYNKYLFIFIINSKFIQNKFKALF